jgi:diadenosine tetraphosphate (Ap4A) HIT family hydrolase
MTKFATQLIPITYYYGAPTSSLLPLGAMTTLLADCPLCQQPGGTLLWQSTYLRVVEIEDADYLGYTRAFWNSHIPEMTDLSRHDRELMMEAVWRIEEAQREILRPDKVNVASLGNRVSHLHWHIIPRWRGDRHFPDAVWAPARIGPGQAPPEWMSHMASIQAVMPRYRDRLLEMLNALPPH